MKSRGVWVCVGLSACVVACGDVSNVVGETDADDGESQTGGAQPEPARITRAFGELALDAYEDNTSRCVSWTLDNEEAIYAQAVVMANQGGFHHSNWFVVSEDDFEGPDGYWRCGDRGYNEVEAARKGTVLFAQSTQSFTEEQRLTPGAVVKLPARAKVVAGLHTLNPSPRETRSGLWLTLEPIHPADVTAVVTPLAIQYHDLDIPAQKESRFTTDCDFSSRYETVTSQPLDMRVHYILPHYHYLGNFFDVTVNGGVYDGMSIFRLEGFDGDGNGRTFSPPLELVGATGLRVTCGYDNWRSDNVLWGDGDGEMCVMMALIEADAVMAGTVASGSRIVDVDDDITMHEGSCFELVLAKHPDQGMPTQAEMNAPLYLPPVDPADADIPPVPACIDTDPGVAAEQPATLSSIRDTIFSPACTFSSCHGAAAAGGLDLLREDLHEALMSHTTRADAGIPLVQPGDANESWLYRVLSSCEPQLATGAVASHMPLNAPTLLDAALVAKVRAWIDAGAPND
jgi:hypothetical protein